MLPFRSTVASALTCSMLAFSSPLLAQEQPSATAQTIAIATSPNQEIDLGMWQSQLPVHTLGLHADNAFTASPTMQEIRLSRGAKIAIIVVAIVVGVLIITGGIIIATPHH